MTLVLIAAGWLVCSGASYYLSRKEWLIHHDWTRNDRVRLASLAVAFGPLALWGSIADYYETSGRGRQVLVHRRGVKR